MYGALFKLVRLQLKAWLRRQFSGGSVRRTVFGVLAIIFFFAWFAAVMIGSSVQKPAEAPDAMAIVPLYLTGFMLLPLLVGGDDRAIAFTPAEIDFLFAGPFSRRSLVLFKLVKVVASSLFGALFFTAFLRRYSATIGGGLVGAGLSMVLVNLVATVFALVRETLQRRVYSVVRTGIGLTLLAAGAGIAWSVTRGGSPMARLKELTSTAPATVILAPGRVFAHLFVARTAPELAAWTAACLAILAGMVVAVLALDGGYMEAAVAASQRRQTRLTRMRKGLAIDSGKPVRAVRLPTMDVLGPPGAIVRKQIITAVRTSRSIVIMFVVAAGYGYFVSRTLGDHTRTEALAGLIPGIMMLLTVIPQMLRFDFRGDLDYLDGLKALPISAGLVALAELTVPTLILIVLFWVILAGVAVFTGLASSLVVMAALGILPLALMMIGLENFVFLILPTRQVVQGQAAFSGRRVAMLLVRFALFILGGGAVAGVGAVVWMATQSVAASFLASWLAMSAIGAGVVCAVAWAYARFDVSVDMPA